YDSDRARSASRRKPLLDHLWSGEAPRGRLYNGPASHPTTRRLVDPHAINGREERSCLLCEGDLGDFRGTSEASGRVRETLRLPPVSASATLPRPEPASA